MTPTIVFDFDGTLAVGAGPVLAYARLVAPAAGEGFLERVDLALAAFEAGGIEHRDGYDVVGTLATSDGVDAVTLSRAYAESRALLGTHAALVETIPELAGFLERLRRHARLALATNAPADGIRELLDRWDVTGLFDALHFTVGKPAGLTPIIRNALATGPVLAVGDIFEFDLAPAAALGADTALVGAAAFREVTPVTMRARTLAALGPEIETWAAAAASPQPAPLGAGTTIER